MAPPSRAAFRARIARFAKSGSIEDNLKLLGVAGLGLFLTLVGCLFLVQRGLIVAQARLTEITMPVQRALHQLDTAMGTAFRRQAELSSTQTEQQLAELRDRSAIEASVRGAQGEVTEGLKRIDDEASESSRKALQDLGAEVDAFLAADDALLGSVTRRQASRVRFEAQLATIDADLRSLIEAANAIAGVLRLEYVVTLRKIAQAMEHGQPPAGLVRRVTIGGTRGSLDDMAELVDATLTLGWLSGKLGLAPSTDALNSVMANEIAQNRALVLGLLRSLDGRLEDKAQRAALADLSARFEKVLPRVADEARDDSLVALRRSVLTETTLASGIRERSSASARSLGVLVAKLRDDAGALAAQTTRDAESAVMRARSISTLVSIAGLVLCVLAALRIRQSVIALQANNRELSELKQNLEHINVNLESMVVDRTEALTQRERALQLVLDSMSDGLLSVATDGSLRAERSKTVVRWFGEPKEGVKVWNYLFAGDPAGASQFHLGFDQLVDEILPFELCADQMLNRLVRDGLTFDLDFQPVRDEGGRIAAIVLTVRDVTLRIEAERAERLAREEQRIIANLLRDKRGFAQMVRECESLLTHVVESDDLVLRRRALHTLKGNCAIFGFVTVAELAHELESELDANQTLPESAGRELVGRWQEALVRIEEFVHNVGAVYEIAEADLQLVIESLRQRTDYKDIVKLVENWRLEPVAGPLKRLASQTRRIASEIGKPVQVDVVDNGVRLPAERFQGVFASVVHAVRNAIDHGIERPETRVRAGKSEEGHITLRVATPEPNQVVLEIEDDGGGIDYEAVARKARARGLPANTIAQLNEALFSDGFSTKSAVSALSGRGVGLSALRASCEQLGGTIALDSNAGTGTCVRCTIPMFEAPRKVSEPHQSLPPTYAHANAGPTRRMSVQSRSMFPGAR